MQLSFFTEHDVDGLFYTKEWLIRSADSLEAKEKSTQGSPQHTPGGTTVGTSSKDTESTSPAQSPNAILNHAYTELLDWDEDNVFPDVRTFITSVSKVSS